MSTLSKRWVIATPAPPEILNRYANIGSVLAQVLYNRGFTDSFEAEDFLNADMELFNPFQMKGINQSVARIRQAIKLHEPM